MRLLAFLVGVVVLATGIAAGWLAARETEAAQTITTTTTETATETAAVGEPSLPSAVEETRAALLDAAREGDYEALRPLVAEDFSYTFGEPVAGGPIAYWQELERTTDERPLETLAAILELPYALSRGVYVWPWAYALTSEAELSDYERALVAPLGDPAQLFAGGSGYAGWRTGIAPDGTWTFFVAGD